MQLQPGFRLGHYELEDILGAGGMGTVYRALDCRLERRVAIKMIRPITGMDVASQLLAEARAACALNHPNICTVHEVGESGEHAFIVMECIEGPSLSQVMAEGPVSRDRAMDLSIQIAGALSHAHERGVVHGDLKAANVLVTSTDRIKVVDFGLAHRRRPDEAHTATVETVGTPYAMAPEQLRGAQPDTRSDVWAMGVLLQELFSGTRPFAATTTPELLGAILHETPAPLPATCAPALRRVIDRCLAREPARRYQRAGEVLAALEAISDVPRAAPAPAHSGEWTLPPPPVLAASATSPIPFVGREDQRRALTTAWDQASGGRRQLVLVSGDPGIGKTRLVMDFAQSVGTSATALIGRCDQEALVPHQPFVEALQWYARHCPAGVLDDHLENVDGIRELVQLLPTLARRVSRLPDSSESNPESQRFRLFEAVSTLMAAMARTRPVLACPRGRALGR